VFRYVFMFSHAGMQKVSPNGQAHPPHQGQLAIHRPFCPQQALTGGWGERTMLGCWIADERTDSRKLSSFEPTSRLCWQTLIATSAPFHLPAQPRKIFRKLLANKSET
jgi:hypothetical protein